MVSEAGLPEALAQAPPSDVFDVPPVAVNFADPGRQYPLHTKAAAWASAACYHASGSADEAAAARIEEACRFYRIGGEWDRLREAATAKKAAAPQGRYALPGRRLYPLDTPEQVKEALDYLGRHAAGLGVDCREFAANTLKAAAELGGHYPLTALARAEAEAGLGRPAETAAEAFALRAKLARFEGRGELASELEKAASAPVTDPAEAAGVLRAVDRRCGWDLTDPMGLLCGATPSSARAELAGVVKAASGAWYARGDLEAVGDGVLSEAFGLPPVVSQETRLGLLADPVKGAAYEALLADAGVRPREQAARPRPDWAALAAPSGRLGPAGSAAAP